MKTVIQYIKDKFYPRCDTINIPIMFYTNSKGKKVLDVENMEQRFNDTIDDIILKELKWIE